MRKDAVIPCPVCDLGEPIVSNTNGTVLVKLDDYLKKDKSRDALLFIKNLDGTTSIRYNEDDWYYCPVCGRSFNRRRKSK